MAIRFKCPACKSLNSADDDMRGQKVRCVDCDKVLRVPIPAESKEKQPQAGPSTKRSTKPGASDRRDESDDEQPPERKGGRREKKNKRAKSGSSVLLISLIGIATLVILVAGGIAAFFLFRDTTQWITLTPPSIGEVTVQFPGQPMERRDEKSLHYTLTADRGKSVYNLSIMRLAPGISLEDKVITKQQLALARDRTLASMRGIDPGSRLLSENDLVIADRFPGQELQFDAPAMGAFRARCVLSSRYAYVISVGGDKTFMEGPTAKRFMESLQITEPTTKTNKVDTGSPSDNKKPAPTPWISYTVKDATAQVRFPGLAKETEMPNGGVLATFDAPDGKGHYHFEVTQHDKPIDIKNVKAVDALIETNRQKMLTDLPGGKSPNRGGGLSQSGAVGRIFEIKLPSGDISRTHLLTTPTHLYRLTVTGPPQFVNGQDGRTFFSSFKLLKQ